MARRGIVNEDSFKLNNNEDKARDERFYTPDPDEKGNVGVKIRFLPSPDAKHPQFVLTKMSHMFDAPNGRVITRCPSSIGEKCAICEENRSLWQAGQESLVRKRKRKIKYIANILILNDERHPENEGKVFLYEFGQKLYDVVDSKLHPKTKIVEPCKVHDYYAGANMNLIGFKDTFTNPAGKRIDFTNYEQSSFDGPSALPEELIDKVDEQLHDLSPINDPSQFLSYEDMKNMLSEKVGGSVRPSVVATQEEVTKETINKTESESPIQQEVKANVEKTSAVDSSTSDFMARLKANL